MNNFKLNILISILSIIAIFMIYFVGKESMYFILSMIFVGAYYIRNNSIHNKVIKKILEFISASLFLVFAFIIMCFTITVVINVIDTFPNLIFESYDNVFMIVSIYLIFRIGIDSFKDYQNKKIGFNSWLKVIALIIVNAVMLRLLFSKLFLGLEDAFLFVNQNGPYFFVMLSACMISSIDFSKKIRLTLEGIIKLLIAIIVSLSVCSIIDTLNIYATSDEYQPIICFHETHSEEKNTYYAFGYSITYHYGEEFVTEYRLFNLIPFYKK